METFFQVTRLGRENMEKETRSREHHLVGECTGCLTMKGDEKGKKTTEFQKENTSISAIRNNQPIKLFLSCVLELDLSSNISLNVLLDILVYFRYKGKYGALCKIGRPLKFGNQHAITSYSMLLVRHYASRYQIMKLMLDFNSLHMKNIVLCKKNDKISEQ